MKQLEKLSDSLNKKFKALDKGELNKVVGGTSYDCTTQSSSTTYVWNPPRTDFSGDYCPDCCSHTVYG
jgi:natural product precursor